MTNARLLYNDAIRDLELSVSGDPKPAQIATFDLNTSTGDQTIQVAAGDRVSVQPFAALVFLSHVRLTSDTVFRNDVGGFSIGAFDGTNQWAVSTVDENGLATTNSATEGSTSLVALIPAVGGTAPVQVSAKEFVNDGITLTVDVTDGNDYRGYVVLFFDGGGSASAGTYTMPSTENDSTDITVGFETSFLFGWNGFGGTNVFSSQQDSAIHSFGYWVPDFRTTGAIWNAADNVGTTETRARVTNNRIPFQAATDKGIEFGDVSDTGFKAYLRGGSAGGGTGAYLAIKSPGVKAFTQILNTATSTGTKNYNTPGFTTETLLGITTACEDLNVAELDSDAEAMGVFALTETEGGFMLQASQDNVSTSDTESRYLANGDINHVGANANAQIEANAYTELANGFQLNYDTVLSTARLWPFLALAKHPDRSIEQLQDSDLGKSWYSLTLNDQVITGSFPLTNINYVYIGNVNGIATVGGVAATDTTYKIELSDDGFSTTKHTETFRTLGKKLVYDEVVAFLSSTIAATDIRITIVDGGGQTETFHRAARLMAGAYLDGPNGPNVSVNKSYRSIERGTITAMRGGHYISEQLTPLRQITVRWEFIPDDDAWGVNSPQSFAEALEVIGHRRDVVLVVYPTWTDEHDISDRDRRHVVYGRKVDDSGLNGNFLAATDSGLQLHSSLSVTVREAL